MSKRVLVLDAMGVIYRSADDVLELLVPFVRKHGGSTDGKYIMREYRRSSLGQMSSAELWQRLGVSAALEDEYLAGHSLSPGLREFLQNVLPDVDSVWCLSNDVSEWSQKLRERNELTAHFAGFVISGDVGIRKPDPGIYDALLSRVGRPAEECIFVDDRVANLDAAQSLGFQTMLFGSAQPDTGHRMVSSFAELKEGLVVRRR
jgi:HAD superfamily hydrolase (TIGR01509 family)